MSTVSVLLQPETKLQHWSALNSYSLDTDILVANDVEFKELVVDSLEVKDLTVTDSCLVGAVDYLTLNGAGTGGQILSCSTPGHVQWINDVRGDVVGPVSSVANVIPIYADTSGKLLGSSTFTASGGSIDRTSAATIAIGPVTATSINLSRTGQTTAVNGLLSVAQAATMSTTLGVAGAVTFNNGTGNSFSLPNSRGVAGQALVSSGGSAPTWSDLTRLTFSFGGDIAAPNDFVVFNGVSDTAPEASATVKASCISPFTGTISSVSWNTTTGGVTSLYDIEVAGVGSHTFGGVNPAGVQYISIPVNVQDKIAIKFVSGTVPGESNFVLYLT